MAVRMDTVQGMAQLALLVDHKSGALYRNLLVPIRPSTLLRTGFLVVEYAIFLLTLASVSDSNNTEMPYLSRLIQTTNVSSRAKLSSRLLNSFASMVQPGVSSFG